METATESGSQSLAMACTSEAAILNTSPKASTMPKVGTNFVIPKNRALVPVTRSTKWEPLDPKKEEPKPMSRKTKWGPDLTQDPVVKRGRALALQTRAEQLAAQLESNNLEIDYNEATRSPSPPPLYDSLGHRMNTREGRKREQLDVERREAVGECMKLNPFYKPPSGFRPVPKEAKLFVPVKEHPGYNFIGLILGPRGNTQKRLEAETGCRITLRGKGSVKEGKQPLRHGKEMEGAYEDLHVHISADTFEKLDNAISIIEPLLIPVDEDRNIYKMKQLRELAEMNGTVRDFTRICTLCGEEGHKEWQCPKDKLQTFQAKVICRLCGDGSHPTMDCPLKISGQGKTIDKEYLSFLEELGAGLGGIDPPTKSDLDGRGADASQPMLLTASGAQPMPSGWMGSETNGDINSRAATDGASENGGFPRFPFPFPFPPPGPHGANAMNLLPRFFHPALFGLFRGRPFPGPMQMMALMFSAFRGRFPFPPFGLRPNMMRPPMPPFESEGPPLSSTPVDSSILGEVQTAESVAEGTEKKTPVVSSGTDEDDKNQEPGIVPMTSSVQAPSFSSLSFSSATTSSLVSPSFQTTAVSPSANISSVSTSVPSMPNVPPPLLSPLGYPIAPVTALPSFRPLPSVRPAIPSIAMSPSFTNPGLGPPPVTPWGVTSNISGISGLDLCRPSEVQTISWSQSQYSKEPASTIQVDKSSFESTSSQFFPTPSSPPPPPPRIDTTYPVNSGENPTLMTAALSCPSIFSSLQPPSDSTELRSIAPPSYPFVKPSSFTPHLPQSPQSEFGKFMNNQPTDDYQTSYANARLGLPPLMGSHFKSGASMNDRQPVLDYAPLSSLSHHPTLSEQSYLFHPQDARASSREQMAPHGATFSRLGFSYASGLQGPSYTTLSGSYLSGELSNNDIYRSGQSVSEHQGLMLPSTRLPSQGFSNNEMPYRYEPSISMPALEQHSGIWNDWNSNLSSGSRLAVRQAWGQPESGISSWSDENAGMNSGDRSRF